MAYSSSYRYNYPMTFALSFFYKSPLKTTHILHFSQSLLLIATVNYTLSSYN